MYIINHIPTDDKGNTVEFGSIKHTHFREVRSHNVGQIVMNHAKNKFYRVNGDGSLRKLSKKEVLKYVDESLAAVEEVNNV